MHIYFSGIGGAGIGSLALVARDAGLAVSGSDQEASRNTKKLAAAGIRIDIGQTGQKIAAAHQADPIDWMVVSAAIPPGHTELQFAMNHGIKISKRHELLNYIIAEKRLKLIAVSGTHGKTTATGMLVWILTQLGLAVSYSIGTNLAFGASGKYTLDSKYFVYEADEFDRNMLQFQPYISLIPALEYDHPDIYKDVEDYKAAFRKFISQSHCTYTWTDIGKYLGFQDQTCLHFLDPQDSSSAELTLAGEHNRRHAQLVTKAAHDLLQTPYSELHTAINAFPGTERRFEKLAEHLYSDYAHLPAEIAATLQLAGELSQNIVAIYQPHQNIRQHSIQDHYGDCFRLAKKIYWLPTYLSREDSNLPILKPTDLLARLNPAIQERTEAAEMDKELVKKVNEHRRNDDLVVVMGAGSIDPWTRQNLI